MSAPKIAKGFIQYLKDEEQYALLPEIVKELQEEVFRNQDISVISATKLSAAEEKDISKMVTDKWGEHRVVFTTDAAILSGLIIRFQDNILDLSGRASLQDLKTQLSQSA